MLGGVMDNNIESKLAFEKLAMVIDDMPRVASAHIILGLLIVFALSEEFSATSLWYWYAFIIVTIFTRVLHALYVKRYCDMRHYKLHYNLFWLGLVLTATIWASSAFFFFPQSGELKLFLIVCVAGLSSGSISSSSQIYIYLVSFVTILLLPFIFVFSFEGTRIASFIAIALSSYIILILVVARKNNQVTDAALRSGYQNEQLVIELNDLVVEAKSASEAKSTFLSTMSHEIRTPLNAILGYISILQKEEKSDSKKKYLNIVEYSSHMLLGVINDILDFNKISSNNLKLEMHSCAIQKELFNIIELFVPMCRDKHIDLKWEIDSTIPEFISTDILRVNQILTNLISNAIKFTPDNKSILFQAVYRDERIYFEIIDEGIGIDASKQALIFESFKQADGSTTREFGGTGLGLSISSELTKLFGSQLSVQSSLGEGSTFSFSIPATICEAIDMEETFDARVFNDETILVAEDNKTNQMLIKVLLQEMHLHCDIANDGHEVIQAYNSSYPLVLMDINMPNMNGEDAMMQIKKHHPEAKIIALTANALVEDREHYLKLGFDAYLSKPIDTEELNTLLSKMIDKPV